MTRPAFPFDPATIHVGAGEVAIIVLLAAAAAATWRALGGNPVPPELDPEAAATAIGLVLVAAVLLIWLVNPFLGLLAVPIAHAWVPQGARARPLARLRTSLVIALALLPVALAVAAVASGFIWAPRFPGRHW